MSELSYSYRAIYMGSDHWIVRRFGVDGPKETCFVLKVPCDPQLRQADKLAIEEAKKRNDWRSC